MEVDNFLSLFQKFLSMILCVSGVSLCALGRRVHGRKCQAEEKLLRSEGPVQVPASVPSKTAPCLVFLNVNFCLSVFLILLCR